jgi:hypothetical protein
MFVCLLKTFESSSRARALPAPEQVKMHSRLAGRIYLRIVQGGYGVLDAACLNGGEPPHSIYHFTVL